MVFKANVIYSALMTPETFIQTLIDSRRLANLTQAELAERAHVSRRTIIDFEAGKSDIGMRRLMRILSALNLSLSVGPASERPTESELRDLFKDDDE